MESNRRGSSGTQFLSRAHSANHISVTAGQTETAEASTRMLMCLAKNPGSTIPSAYLPRSPAGVTHGTRHKLPASTAGGIGGVPGAQQYRCGRLSRRGKTGQGVLLPDRAGGAMTAAAASVLPATGTSYPAPGPLSSMEGDWRNRRTLGVPLAVDFRRAPSVLAVEE